MNETLFADLNVKETEENEAVVNTVRDLHRLVSSKYLPAVQSWIQVILESIKLLIPFDFYLNVFLYDITRLIYVWAQLLICGSARIIQHPFTLHWV